MESVTSDRLAACLQVRKETLHEWRKAGFLVLAKTLHYVPHYSVKSVDAFLRRRATNRAVTAIDILQGRVKLLTLEQAARKLDTTPRALQQRATSGSLPAIKLASEWRVVEADIDAILADINNPDYIPQDDVGHIFGSASYVKECIKRGELRCVTISAKPLRKPVTLESILALVRRLVPRWVDAEAWVKERREDSRPLLELHEFERFLGLGLGKGRDFLSANKARYLEMNRAWVRVSPVSAGELLLKQPRLTTKQIADIFAVDESAVSRALQSRDLRCGLHYHRDKSELKRGCVVELLRTCLSPGVVHKVKWYEKRLAKPEPLMSVAEAATFYGISEAQVLRRIQEGGLAAVKLPGRSAEWRIVKGNLR